MRSVQYLLLSTLKTALGRGLACPSCGSPPSETLDRKYVVTAFRRCANCKLLFRTPTTTALENERFYQSDYEEGFTTDLPTDEQLKALLASSFEGHEKSYRVYVNVLRALGMREGARIFDFGCSWGYGSYQLAQAGYKVDSFEISKPRARFAREKLGLSLGEPSSFEPHSYDLFFSSHVIEHVPSVRELFSLAEGMLRPGGLFVAFTPNGSLARRQRNPRAWRLNWGAVHPQLIDEEFLRHALAGRDLLVTTDPYNLEEISRWRGESVIGRVDGDELLFAFRNPVA